jgi:hypothetical protein
MTTPGSPSGRTRIPGKATAERDRILNDLSVRWGLIIQPPKDGESPSKRLEKLAIARKAETYPEECFFKIHFLCLKDESALLTSLKNFQYAANALQSSWVYKPNADDDLLPRSPRSKPFGTAAQREQLFQCLLRFITPAFEQAKEKAKEKAKECQIKSTITLGSATPLSHVTLPVFTPQHIAERHVVDEQLDDTPIPFPLGAKRRGERLSDGDEDLNDASKRSKGLPDDSASQEIIDAVDNVPTVICQTGIGTWPTAARLIPIDGSSALSVAAAFKVPDLPRNTSSDDRNQRRQGEQPETANTSVTSSVSVFSSVFDEVMSDASDESYFSTETSVMDTSSDRRWAQDQETPAEMDSTEYGSSVGDFEIIDGISFTPEDLLRKRLQSVFREYLYPFQYTFYCI